MLKIAIEKTDIQKMPQVMFPGDIYIIDSMLNVKAAVNVLRNAELVGFDTETRPSFRKGVMHKTALIQISTLDECFLFRVNRIGMPKVLADYIADPACQKVGLSLHDDFKMLSHLSDVEPAGFIDLQERVGNFGVSAHHGRNSDFSASC